MGELEGETTGSSRAHEKRPSFATINCITKFLFFISEPYLRDFTTNGKMESKTKWEVKIDAWCIKQSVRFE
ncbi:hypothetical protein [Psychrobacillus sp. NPDC096623]|uniref:hypothetical protein n=1 Tax=Psychrobacillus sp. NPDC096623 TaxID=3364492 RepID=UPI0037FF3992